jgi:hypothetical protein
MNPDTNGKLSVQERWGKAAEEGIAAARLMTDEEILHQGRVNSGWYKTKEDEGVGAETARKSRLAKNEK